jgi:short-subunit dehydrogenase
MNAARERGRPVALITGASQGIGYELAKCFAGDGHDLVLVARDPRRLENAAAEISAAFGVEARPIALDLSKAEDARRLIEQLEGSGIAIDVLVNNAGFGLYGEFASSDLQSDLEMMRLNMESLAVLTRLFLPQMLERGRGRILNVGSTAGFQPGPLMALYYASKAFVLSFSEALANELRGSGVSVCVLCPGPTRTGFQDRAGIGALFRRGVMSAAQVAAIGYRDFKRGKTTIIPGLRNKLLAFSVRFAPRSLVPGIVRRLQENRAAEKLRPGP